MAPKSPEPSERSSLENVRDLLDAARAHLDVVEKAADESDVGLYVVEDETGGSANTVYHGGLATLEHVLGRLQPEARLVPYEARLGDRIEITNIGGDAGKITWWGGSLTRTQEARGVSRALVVGRAYWTATIRVGELHSKYLVLAHSDRAVRESVIVYLQGCLNMPLARDVVGLGVARRAHDVRFDAVDRVEDDESIVGRFHNVILDGGKLVVLSEVIAAQVRAGK